MSFERWSASAVVLPNSTVYVVGGHDPAELFDGTSWSLAPDFPKKGDGHCMVYLPSGSILLTGGRWNWGSVSLGSLKDSKETYIMEASTGAWSRKTDMQHPR